MVTITHKCLRCEYQWVARLLAMDSRGRVTVVKPKHCARCHSPYWDRPITRLTVSRARKQKQHQ